MTVSSETAKSGPYTGNGVTTVFAYGFRILSASHLEVVRTTDGVDSTVSPSDYTVSGVGSISGGSVTFSVAPASGETVTIIRNAPFTQQTDLENQGAFLAEVVEEALDLAAMRDQQLYEELTRALKIPVGSMISGTEEAIETLLVFGAIYLGAQPTAPTVRADGTPLTGGELYFDTNLRSLSVWTGTVWTSISSSVNGTLSRQSYTATSGQTEFAITYDVGFVDVWLNGMKLVAGDDFTATNGTSIILSSGASLGDSVDIIAFGSFSLIDVDTALAGKQPVDADLTSLAGLSGAGLIARTGAGAHAERTITGTANQIAVVNGDGVAGSPTISAVTATSLEAQAGSDTTKLMTPASTRSALDGHLITRNIGWGQTWQDVLASRTFNTSYLNNTARPIQVVVRGGSSIANFEVSPDNVTWIVVCQIGGSPFHFSHTVIPNGWYYRVNGTITLNTWVELR